MKNLERLFLDGTRVPGTGFENLKNLTNLRELTINGKQLASPALENLKSLQHLRVAPTKQNHHGHLQLENVACLNGLKSLDLTGTEVIDADLAPLSQLTTLESLKIGNT